MIPLPASAPVNRRSQSVVHETFNLLYAIFQQDSKNLTTLRRRPVFVLPRDRGGREMIFWHMTGSKDQEKLGERFRTQTVRTAPITSSDD